MHLWLGVKLKWSRLSFFIYFWISLFLSPPHHQLWFWRIVSPVSEHVYSSHRNPGLKNHSLSPRLSCILHGTEEKSLEKSSPVYKKGKNGMLLLFRGGWGWPCYVCTNIHVAQIFLSPSDPFFECDCDSSDPSNSSSTDGIRTRKVAIENWTKNAFRISNESSLQNFLCNLGWRWARKIRFLSCVCVP